MNIRTLFLSALALGAVATTANALTVMNLDNAPYTLKVMPKAGKAMDLALKAKGNAEIDCKAGCSITLNGKSQAFDGKTAKVMIKGAVFTLK